VPFIQHIIQHNSVSIVGLAKNTGKTTCLNYVLKRLQTMQKRIAITSIGVDGEERDVLYDTPKPRITLHENMVFVTSEQDFANREFEAEILSVSERATPLGRLVTARALSSGKVVISGPSDSLWLQEMIAEMPKYNVQLTLIDGALSRLSLASPAVTDAMILCTGAAYAVQLPDLIRKTVFRCRLIDLEQVETEMQNKLQSILNGVWQIDKQGEMREIADSVFTFPNEIEKLSDTVQTIYVSGALTDNFLKALSAQRKIDIQLIVRDFSRLFFEEGTYNRFIRRGGTIKVLQKAKLLAVCTNPTSPEGYKMKAVELREQMQEALQLPVYDIRLIETPDERK